MDVPTMKRVTPLNIGVFGFTIFAIGFVWYAILYHRIDAQLSKRIGPDWAKYVDIDWHYEIPQLAIVLLGTGAVIIIASIVWAIARRARHKFSN